MTGDTESVILLSAPSGFGKSVLLQQWRRLDSRPGFEILLGPEHNDPSLLVQTIIDVLSPLEPFPAGPDDAMLGPSPDFENVVIPRLISALKDRSHPFTLAFDELEQIDSPDSLKVVAALFRGMPHGSQLAIASRTEFPLGLGRMRASRQLTELGRKELTMTRRESAELLTSIDVELTTTQLDAIVRRTEGWPAVLYLAGLALGESPDPDLALARITGDDRMIVDYLREEFLLPVSPETAIFLRRASVLKRLNGPLCDAVLEREGSASLLRDLSRANMLLIPLGTRGGEYRLHPMLREMLHSELCRIEPATPAELHRRASRWWAREGDPDQAIHHAIEGRAVELAGSLLFEAFPEYSSRGRNATIIHWLDRLGPEDAAKSPGACVTAAWAELTFGSGPQTELWMARANRLLPLGSTGPSDPSMAVALALAEATLCRDGLEAMRDTVAEVEPLLPEADPWCALCSLLDGVGMYLAGNRDGARARLKEGVRRGSVGAPDLQVLSLSEIALMACDEGQWQLADDSMAHARAQIDRTGLSDYPVIALAFAVSAFTRAMQGFAEHADKDLESGLGLLSRLDQFAPWHEIQTKVALGQASARLGKLTQAEALLVSAFEQLDEISERSVLEERIRDAQAALDGSALEGAQLSPAELRVLRYLPEYLSYPQIADELHLSSNTVKTHVRSIYRKLESSSRREAVERARGIRLLPPG